MEEGTNAPQWVRMTLLPHLSWISSTRYSRSGCGFHVETARTVRVLGRSKAFELPTVQLRPLRRVRPRRGYHDTLPG